MNSLAKQGSSLVRCIWYHRHCCCWTSVVPHTPTWIGHGQWVCVVIRGEGDSIHIRVTLNPWNLCIPATLLTLSTHAQRGLQYLVCVSVCVCVCYHIFCHTSNKPAKKRHQRVQLYTGLILKLAIFVKILRAHTSTAWSSPSISDPHMRMGNAM